PAYVDPAVMISHRDAVGSPLWVVRAADGTDTGTLLGEVRQAVAPYGDGLRVLTSDEYGTEVAKSLTQGIDVFASILLVFGAIAVLVGLLIIANTFTILVAQRRQQIGLLRAVGDRKSPRLNSSHVSISYA